MSAFTILSTKRNVIKTKRFFKNLKKEEKAQRVSKELYISSSSGTESHAIILRVGVKLGGNTRGMVRMEQ